MGGSDAFPALPENPAELVATIADVARAESTLATHDVSHGGLAVALAELLTAEAGADVTVDDAVALFDETPGRVVIETTDPESVREAFDGVAAVQSLGTATDDGVLSLTVDGETVEYDAETITALRQTIPETLG